MKISVCCPSYKRSIKVKTVDYIPTIRVYVDPSEFGDYVLNNPGTKIIACDEGVQGNLCRVRNYIIRKELEENDAVCIVDDDLSGLYYWEQQVAVKIRMEEIADFLNKHTIMAKDLKVYLWGININKDKQIYREYSPISTLSYIGGPFMVFLKGNNCWFDERFSLKEDYDMTLQQLNLNRCILRFNKFFYDVKQGKQKGGCASYRSYTEEERQLNDLIKKWGSSIVKKDRANRSHNLKKSKKQIDYNPIITVPIRGI